MTTPRRRAALDLAMKFGLEVSFQRSLKKLFLTIANDIESTYINSELVLDVLEYKLDLQAMLKEHYRKISRAFKFNLRDTIKAVTDREIAMAIDTQLTTFINAQTGYQSDLIISTLGEDIAATVDTVIIDAAAEGVQLPKVKIASKVKKKFKDSIEGKASVISGTETQIMAEKTKLVEAVNLQQLKEMRLVKQWVSTLDEVTRVAHVFADGQIQELGDPFIVGGERLLIPGDSSLGASAGNIIECRCDAIYLPIK